MRHLVVLVLLLAGCGKSPQHIPGLWDVPIQTVTSHPPTKTPHPTATPEQAPPIIITPTSGKTNEDATFFLTVIVENGYGYLREAMVTISWEDGREPVTFGPTFDIKIPIQASSSPFLLTVEKEGYLSVNQPFWVSLSEDVQYEFSAVLLPIEDFVKTDDATETAIRGLGPASQKWFNPEFLTTLTSGSDSCNPAKSSDFQISISASLPLVVSLN